MTDIKELLTLAANACGIDAEAESVLSVEREGLWLKGRRTTDNSTHWKPHIDDGDCFRMETELSMRIKHVYWALPQQPPRVIVEAEHFGIFAYDIQTYETHNGDKNAARRLASLRVAAELGRRMT